MFNMGAKLSKNAGLKLALTAALLFFSFTLIFTLHRHYTFYSSYDQGIFNQVFWNNLHGRFFESSLSSQLSTNVVHDQQVPEVYYHRLGQHFTPALLLWWPIYALFPHPATLTVLLVTFITAAGLVLYALARQYTEPYTAGMITGSFYCANAVLGPTLNNFHDIAQIPLFVFTLLLAMEKRWWWLFWLLACLIPTVREDSGITLFGIGVYLVLSRRYPRTGLALCLFSFAYMVLLTNLIMPLFSEDISKRFMLERFGQYVEGDEASTLEVIWAMLSKPWLLLVELVTPLDRTINYLLGQLLPFAFVPVLSPAAWMIAGFPLLKLLLGKGFSVLAIGIRYAMSVVPGLCYGAILWWGGQGIRRFHQPKASLQPRPLTTRMRRLWMFCLALSLIFTITSSPNRTFYFLFPDSVQPGVYVSLPEQWRRTGQIRSLMAQIRPEASVTATTYIIPHLSGRRAIIRFPGLEVRNDNQEVVKVDYILVDLWRLQRYEVAFTHDRNRLRDMTRTIDRITHDREYGVIGFSNGVILLQKDTADNQEAKAQWLIYRQQLEPILHKGDD